MHPVGIQPSGAGTPDAPQRSEKPRAVGTPRYGPHGVGLTGMSVTSQCLQNRFLGLALLGASGSTSTSTYFLLCKRGEENAMGTACGTGSLHPRPASKEQPSRSFISPQNIFFFPRFPPHAQFDGCAHAKCTEKARDERAPGEREGHKPARDESVLAV